MTPCEICEVCGVPAVHFYRGLLPYKEGPFARCGKCKLPRYDYLKSQFKEIDLSEFFSSFGI